MIDIEEQLLKWAETEDITEISERRSLILYKLLETELENLYLAHLANFKTNVVSAHRDFECIRRLHQDLRLIAAAHRHHRGLVGLPFTTPECDFLPKFSHALEIYTLTVTTQGSVLDTYSQYEQHVNQTATHASYEHKAQENEPLIQKADHEHQVQDRKGSVEGVDLRLNAIPISSINPEAIPRTEQDVSPHQDTDFSNLQLIATAPQESSTLQLLHTATQSLNAISTHVSSLDQSYARLRDDTNITRHHTTKLCDELKSTAEGFDIRIDVLEQTLTQLMVDELAVAPGSDQFHEEIGTSTVGGFGLLIRSTTGIPIPSPVCTRKLDEDFTNGISSLEWSEQDFRRRRRGEERRGKKNIS
ncbi:putative LRR receptor-like serine/threonine-protein kinase [Dorcoceras hygrometricum]|uniref:Putative LRR receptor-like serine/threonine-protein kinase n=1 Tax=Dorcoceras hygrometricum TaxID=472368 RepID=A0A2Z7D2A6_9LAMI|nr:putative LRR receptor-like serine/threonine-protein kinase [Dorcoceras hygrometricum]